MGIEFVLAFFLIIILLLIVRYIIGSANDIEMFDIQEKEYWRRIKIIKRYRFRYRWKIVNRYIFFIIY